MPAASARSSARTPARFDATAATGKPVVDQRLEVRPLAGDEHADHAIRPITCRPARRSGTTAHIADPEVEDAPQLLLVHVRARATRRRADAPSVPVDLGGSPSGQHAREVSQDAAAGDVRERLRRRARSARTSSR